MPGNPATRGRIAEQIWSKAVQEPTGIEPFMFLDGAFTNQELDAIVAYGDGLQKAEAVIKDAADQEQQSAIRITRISWIMQAPDTLWLYQKLAEVTRHLNQQSYRFELEALQNLQYTVYLSGEGGHYDWHVDHGQSGPRRKLSLVLQLSSPDDYEGCDLQVHASNTIDTVPKTRGTLIAFPSYVLHRVTPITRGTRRSLVMWCSGQRFR